MTDFVELIERRTKEIEALFSTVDTSPVSAYVEIPIGGLGKLKTEMPKADEPTETNTKRIYFAVVRSNGIYETGSLPTDNHEFTSPGAAFLAWSGNMDRFLADNTGRSKLFWRCRPVLESEKDFETDTTKWQVYSRLGIM